MAVALVLLNAFFVAAEFSLIKVRASRIAELAEEKRFAAGQVNHSLQHLNSYLAATQLGITLASLGLGWLGGPAVAALFGPLFDAARIPSGLANSLSFVSAFALIVIVHFTIGELLPRQVGLTHPERTSLLLALPLRIFHSAARPAIWLLTGLSGFLLRIAGIHDEGDDGIHSEDELRLLVAASAHSGSLDSVEEEMASRSLGFGELSLRELMVPRMMLTTLSADASLDQARQAMLATGHARLPVCAPGNEEILGVIDWADLFAERSTPWMDRIQNIPLLFEGSSASAALSALRKTEMEEAAVLNEYGGLAGYLTLSDLLGSVTDEAISWRPGAALDATTPLRGLARQLQLELPAHKVISVGGYVSERLGRVGRVGEKVSLDGWTIEITEAEPTCVLRVLIYRDPDPAEL